MSSSVKLSLDASGKCIDPTLYRSMIGSLLYLTTSCLDISFSVRACARYQASPKESYLTIVKRIIRYVKGSCDFGVWYSHGLNLTLVGFSNAN